MKKYIFVVVGVIFIGLAYYAISPLFRTITLNESSPVTTGGDKNTQTTLVAPVTPTPAHPASGTVRVVTGEGKTFIRYEDYKTINGPDLYIYLAKDLTAKEFINLGRIKATEGNVNYEIPPEINLADYPYVLTWCKAFGVLFNSANLSTLL